MLGVNFCLNNDIKGNTIIVNMNIIIYQLIVIDNEAKIGNEIDDFNQKYIVSCNDDDSSIYNTIVIDFSLLC